MKKQSSQGVYLLAACLSVGAVSAQTYQPLPGYAAQFDLFTLAGPDSEMIFKEGNFDGIMGFGAGSTNETESDLLFGGEVRYHDTAGVTWAATSTSPTAVTTHAAGLHNSLLGLVDTAINNYANNLKTLTPSVASFGNYVGDSNGFSHTAATDVTVLDFDSLTMTGGATPSFTLNGRPGMNDVFVIRISGNTLFEEGGGGKDKDGGTSDVGVPVILNNLDRRNVVWLATGEQSEFDLHRNGQANFEGVIINQASGDDYTIIGGVDFTGQVYSAGMKLGTGVVFEGSSITDPIPEPSAHLLLLGAAGFLTFRRRR